MTDYRVVAVSSSGVGFCTLLGLVFIVLKLTHYIEWGWFFVLMPFWLGIAFWLAVMMLALILGGIVWLFSNKP